MIHVLAIITTKPSMRDLVLTIFKANVPNVLAEKGCIEYTPTIDEVDGPSWGTKFGADTFVVIEKWESMEDLNNHAAAPHMAKYGQDVKDYVEGRVIHVLSNA